MAAKLKLLLRNPQSPLILKALTYGIFLALAKIGGFQFSSVFVFLLAALFLYSKPIFNTRLLLKPFLILLILSFVLLKAISGIWPLILSVALLSFSFYLILGLKNLVFIDRAKWQHVLYLLLLYAAFISLFLSDRSEHFFIKSLLIFLLALVFFGDFLKIAAPEFSGRRVLISWVLALVIMESIWAISLLPIGFLNSANLAVILAFVLSGLTLKHFQGILTPRVIFSELGLFVVLVLLVFLTSRWSLNP